MVGWISSLEKGTSLIISGLEAGNRIKVWEMTVRGFLLSLRSSTVSYIAGVQPESGFCWEK